MIHSVCVFGDSISKGVIFDAAKNKYRLLKDGFTNLVGNQKNIVFSNYARFGCTVSMGINILKKHESKLDSFDYTLLEFGGNDCDYKWKEVSDQPEKEHLCNTPIPVFREQYLTLINLVKQNNGKPILLSIPPIDSTRYFKWISKGLNPTNILSFLGEIETIYAWQEKYNTIILELAEACKVPLIDIRHSFLESGNYADYLCEDGIHPNEKGHLLIAKSMAEQFPIG